MSETTGQGIVNNPTAWKCDLCACTIPYGYIISQNQKYRQLRMIPTVCDKEGCGHPLEVHRPLKN